MGAYESMKGFLKKTGLYSLSGGTIVDFELQAYAAGLDALTEEFNELQRESFVNTSSGYGLENREEAFGLPHTGELADRRNAVLKLGAVTENSFTKDSLKSLFEAFGLSADISEDTANGKITVKFLKLPSCGISKAIKIVNNFTPAHLTVKTDFSGAT